MAELNLDISQELNITARRGDSISFTLTFKNSSGDALDLSSSDADGQPSYDFNMQVRVSADDDSDSPVLKNKENETETLPQRGAPTTNGSTGEIEVDDSQAGSGDITFKIDSSSMKNIPSGVYVYDIEYVKTVGTAETKQTWVRGTFTVNEDVTIS